MRNYQRNFFAAFAVCCCSFISPISPFHWTDVSAQTFSNPDNQFYAGPWEGTAQFLDDGTFFACLVVNDYGKGQSAAFGINRDYSFWFGLSSDSWSLARQTRYRVTYEIDSFAPVNVVASAPFSNMVMADFPDEEQTFQRIKLAKAMKVKIIDLNVGIKIDFTHLDKAMPALIDCVDKNTGSKTGDDFRNADPEGGNKAFQISPLKDFL